MHFDEKSQNSIFSTIAEQILLIPTRLPSPPGWHPRMLTCCAMPVDSSNKMIVIPRKLDFAYCGQKSAMMRMKTIVNPDRLIWNLKALGC